MKSLLYRTLLIAAAIVVICGTYLVTSRASCTNCNFVGAGFAITADCTKTYSSICPSGYDLCQKDHCVYVAGLPNNPHNVYSYGELCATEADACMKGKATACSDKNGPN